MVDKIVDKSRMQYAYLSFVFACKIASWKEDEEGEGKWETYDTER